MLQHGAVRLRLLHHGRVQSCLRWQRACFSVWSQSHARSTIASLRPKALNDIDSRGLKPISGSGESNALQLSPPLSTGGTDPAGEDIAADAEFDNVAASEKTALDIFEAAHKSGVIKVDGSIAFNFVQTVGKLSAQKSFTAQSFQNACIEHSISIDDAYTVGRLLLTFRTAFDHALGRNILLNASKLGSAKATLYLIKKAIDHDVDADNDDPGQLAHPSLQASLQHLDKLITRNEAVLPAIVLQAKRAELASDHHAAEKLYEQAITAGEHAQPKPTLYERWIKLVGDGGDDTHVPVEGQQKVNVDDSDTDLDLASARMALAELQAYHLGKLDEATRNWEVAALKHDDPMAYFKLAGMIEGEKKLTHKWRDLANDPLELDWLHYVPCRWYDFTLKAAASGHAEACYNMASIFLLRQMHVMRQRYLHKSGSGHEKFLDPDLQERIKDDPLIADMLRFAYREPHHKRVPARSFQWVSSTRKSRFLAYVFLTWKDTALGLGYAPAQLLTHQVVWNELLHQSEIARLDDEQKDWSAATLGDVAALLKTPTLGWPAIPEQAAALFGWMVNSKIGPKALERVKLRMETPDTNEEFKRKMDLVYYGMANYQWMVEQRTRELHY